MAKEVVELNHNYYSLRTKVDIIVDAVTKVIECYTSLAPKIEKKAEVDVQAFEKMDKLLTDLKDLVSKSSSSSLLTPEFLTQKFRLLESSIHNELAPIAKLANLMPTDAPPVSTEVQEGERKSVGMSSRTVKGEGASGKTEGDAKVVGIVKSNQIPLRCLRVMIQ
ncbi:unnamed protein product [Lactuca saligna]|uniref:Uncharacterized protein n=1 Tax=Lactuca saligna TaxID=75948 RepID=A0AA35Y9Z4_LACSI|nr:unnamed protein product [Lactuca saligna]